MTSTPPLPAGTSSPVHDQQKALGAESVAESLVPSQRQAAMPGTSLAVLAQLLVELDISIPIRQFRVRNLLALEAGQVIETRWGNAEDLPLAVGDVQLAWCEFEVVNNRLAVRLTRLA